MAPPGAAGPRRVELDDDGGARRRHPAGSSTTSTRSSTAPTSSSSTPWAPATAAWSRREDREFHTTSATWRRGRVIRLTARATRAGRAPSTSSASPTAPRARRGSRATCWSATHVPERDHAHLLRARLHVLRIDTNNDLPRFLFLPTSHPPRVPPRLPADLQAKPLRDVLREVEAFAGGEYAARALRGAKLSAAERSAIAAKVARYTGLTPEYVERTNLRVEIFPLLQGVAARRRAHRGPPRQPLHRRRPRLRRRAFRVRDPGFAEIYGGLRRGDERLRAPRAQVRADAPYEVLKACTSTGDGRTSPTAMPPSAKRCARPSR